MIMFASSAGAHLSFRLVITHYYSHYIMRRLAVLISDADETYRTRHIISHVRRIKATDSEPRCDFACRCMMSACC